MGFLPENYEPPKSSSNYMKFEEGQNKFRVLSDAVLGWEGWKTDDDGTRRPVRVPMDESLSVDDVDEEDRIKHFWAFAVYNYKVGRVQILEITQKTIQRELGALHRSKEWGDIKGYDIIVGRTGKTMQDTEFTVTPVPPKPVDKEIVKKYEETKINLNALFTGDDPFAESKKDEAKDNSLTDEDIEEALKEVS